VKSLNFNVYLFLSFILFSCHQLSAGDNDFNGTYEDQCRVEDLSRLTSETRLFHYLQLDNPAVNSSVRSKLDDSANSPVGVNGFLSVENSPVFDERLRSSFFSYDAPNMTSKPRASYFSYSNSKNEKTRALFLPIDETIDNMNQQITALQAYAANPFITNDPIRFLCDCGIRLEWSKNIACKDFNSQKRDVLKRISYVQVIKSALEGRERSKSLTFK